MEGDLCLRVVEVLMDLEEAHRLKVFRLYILNEFYITERERIIYFKVRGTTISSKLAYTEQFKFVSHLPLNHQVAGINIILNQSSLRNEPKIMRNFMFGENNNEYIEASYAPSGRARCRGCKDIIAKDELRMGQIMEDDHFNARYYYHLHCFDLKPRFKTIDPETQVYKLDGLEDADADKVRSHLRSQIQRLNHGKKKKKGASPQKQSKSRKSTTKKIEEAPPRVTRGRARQQAQKDKQSASRSAKSKKKGLTPSKSQQSVSVKQVEADRKTDRSGLKSSRAASVKAKPKKNPKKKMQPRGYSAAQRKEFNELVQSYLQKTADQLKTILGLNGQSRTGNKKDLAERCADGRLLGRIPMCTSCGGGKLRFNNKTGVYSCPGFMDDDEFKSCYKQFSISQVTRDPWVET